MNRTNLILFGPLFFGCSSQKTTPTSAAPPAEADARLDDSADSVPDQGDDSGADTGTPAGDAERPDDRNPADTGAGPYNSDTAPPDEPGPSATFGIISGDCGVLSLPGDSGRLVQNAIDFGTTPFAPERLSDGGAEIFADGTLGGSSVHSEVMAYEVLHRCETALLIKSETEISYIDPAGKKTDILVSIDGVPVGVSVTRAFKWGDDVIYTEEDARSLLSDKLSDVLLSQANVAPSDAWSHSLLHVMTHDASYLPSLESAYSALPEDLTGETIVWFTVTDGNDDFVY